MHEDDVETHTTVENSLTQLQISNQLRVY